MLGLDKTNATILNNIRHKTTVYSPICVQMQTGLRIRSNHYRKMKSSRVKNRTAQRFYPGYRSEEPIILMGQGTDVQLLFILTPLEAVRVY